MKHASANLPLHTGRAPAWLFQRMVRLAGSLAEIGVMELGADAFLDRLSDPFWFQCFGCVLGFDWHSSGLTTTTCGALKESLRGRERALGLYVGGGKGAVSRKTPDEIRRHADAAGVDGERLVYASRMSAKVDSAAVQDGFQIYHHCFFFTAAGNWAVVQQGMNEATRWARRYHWLGDRTASFVCEPHAAVCSDGRPGEHVLNMVAREADGSRAATAEVGRLKPERLLAELKAGLEKEPALQMPARHGILRSDIDSKRMKTVLLQTYERQPEDFETLLGLPGVGPATIRALSLAGELLYGGQRSFRDPARFSFAHGGKDGIPYPVDRKTYDTTIALLEKAIGESRLGQGEKLQALRRMQRFTA